MPETWSPVSIIESPAPNQKGVAHVSAAVFLPREAVRRLIFGDPRARHTGRAGF
jgi:hypothetical protein